LNVDGEKFIAGTDFLGRLHTVPWIVAKIVMIQLDDLPGNFGPNAAPILAEALIGSDTLRGRTVLVAGDRQ
jgi:peptidoglycan/xylan/chitin deacetylase (PgdA/CDA1 family)